MEGKGTPLVFRAWAPGDCARCHDLGHSRAASIRAAVEPDVVLVPLLAFDRPGHRLGYGGGFYDRTLARLRALKPIVAVGLAYDEQRVDAVPHLDYDQPPRLGADAVGPDALSIMMIRPTCKSIPSPLVNGGRVRVRGKSWHHVLWLPLTPALSPLAGRGGTNATSLSG